MDMQQLKEFVRRGSAAQKAVDEIIESHTKQQTAIPKLYTTTKSTTLGDLFAECIRWKFDILQMSDGDEGEPFEAVVVMRGEDTKEYLKALSKTYERLNPDLDDPCFD